MPLLPARNPLAPYTKLDKPPSPYSEAKENVCMDAEDGVESNFDAIVTKVREWGSVTTDFLQTAPWWVWVSGVALLFVVVFLLSVRDARSQPFQTRDDDPWVIDPADN